MFFLALTPGRTRDRALGPSRPTAEILVMSTNQKSSEAEQQRRALQRAMSIARFCKRYDIGRTKTYEEIKAGRLRARKIGKRTVISADDAEAWLDRLPIVVPDAVAQEHQA